jgi:hypothetical protein
VLGYILSCIVHKWCWGRHDIVIVVALAQHFFVLGDCQSCKTIACAAMILTFHSAPSPGRKSFDTCNYIVRYEKGNVAKIFHKVGFQ